MLTKILLPNKNSNDNSPTLSQIIHSIVSSIIKFYELCFLFKFDSLRSVWQINNNVTAGKKEKNELRISISNSLIIEKSRKYRGNEYSVDVRGKETGKVKT